VRREIAAAFARNTRVTQQSFSAFDVLPAWSAPPGGTCTDAVTTRIHANQLLCPEALECRFRMDGAAGRAEAQATPCASKQQWR